MADGKTNRSFLFGIILIIIALLFAANKLNWIPRFYHGFIFSWESLLILIGIILLVTGRNSVPGIILIVVGGFFLLPDIFHVSFHWGRMFWPAMLILVGLLLVFRTSGHIRRGQVHHPIRMGCEN